MGTMLAFAKSPDTKTGDPISHIFTRPEGQVWCESLLIIKSTHEYHAVHQEKRGTGESPLINALKILQCVLFITKK